jgi:hypothetical protein
MYLYFADFLLIYVGIFAGFGGVCLSTQWQTECTLMLICFNLALILMGGVQLRMMVMC